MGNNMYFRSRNVHRPIAFQPPEWAAKYPTEESLGVTRFHAWLDSGYVWQEVGYPYHIIYDSEKIRQEQFRQVLGVWDHIKNHGKHGADNYALEFLSPMPYRRDNRRLRGDYIMTQHDIQTAPLFEDRVAFGAWPVDVHTIGGILTAPEPWLDFDTLWEGLILTVFLTAAFTPAILRTCSWPAGPSVAPGLLSRPPASCPPEV